MIKENIFFFKEFLTEFQTTGSCFPTSRWAAEALTTPMRKKRPAQKILELGPGTGSVTTKILADMQPGDKLTICEINPRFMKALKKKLVTNSHYITHKENVNFFLGPMQDLPEDTEYDLIVCALPFLNFEIAMVKEIFEKLRRLDNENTVLTYYEYIGIRSLAKSMAPLPTKKRFKELDIFFRGVYKENETHRERVWLNMLPINIYTVRFAA